MKKMAALGLIALSVSGCCAISCNGRPPNSHIKVISDIPADCTFTDNAGKREFSAPGEVLGMPKNAPGTLTCTVKNRKPFSKTLKAEDWNLLTSLSDDPSAVRYFSEVVLSFEQEGK
ncbi:MAG: hypothetical protein Q8O37_03245 [Sulfuricellaceae bacterium]|nr:hypothetical protein [Sulfuricellaceae bacterium]